MSHALISIDQTKQLSVSLGAPFFSTTLHLPNNLEGKAGRWMLQNIVGNGDLLSMSIAILQQVEGESYA